MLLADIRTDGRTSPATIAGDGITTFGELQDRMQQVAERDRFIQEVQS